MSQVAPADTAGAASQPPARPSVSIVVPTFREAENLPHLIEQVEQVMHAHALQLEMIIVDDNSDDGTEELIASLDKPWVRLIVRKDERGLSSAVIEGMRRAQHDVLICMDADLSHPPAAIPQLVDRLTNGADFVIGSRYVRGGSTDAEWGLLRWLNSKVATLMARPFTRAADPMAGFFGLRRQTFAEARELNPIGYKIGLELIVKCGCRRIGEVPIHFADRQFGQSKLNFKEQLRYIQHIRRLFVYRYPNWSYMIQFAVVGGSGTVVNLAVLTLLVMLGVWEEIAMAVAILTAMLSNFALNRRFTFSYARNGPILRQLIGFMAACSLGAVVNYLVALGVLTATGDQLPVQVAALAGIAAGMTFNFITSRYVVFHKQKAPH